MNKFIPTYKKVYSPLEVIDSFSQYVTKEHVAALVDHLTDPDLAPNIASFLQVKSTIVFNIGLEDLIK